MHIHCPFLNEVYSSLELINHRKASKYCQSDLSLWPHESERNVFGDDELSTSSWHPSPGTSVRILPWSRDSQRSTASLRQGSTRLAEAGERRSELRAGCCARSERDAKPRLPFGGDVVLSTRSFCFVFRRPSWISLEFVPGLNHDFAVGPVVLDELLPLLPCSDGHHYPGNMVHGESRRVKVERVGMRLNVCRETAGAGEPLSAAAGFADRHLFLCSFIWTFHSDAVLTSFIEREPRKSQLK